MESPAAGVSVVPSVRFLDVARERGVTGSRTMDGMGTGAAAADFDDDGYVDLFLPRSAGRNDQLWRNLGNGRFEEASGRGISTSGSRVGLWFDYDGDGLLDLMVANDDVTRATPFTLYRQRPDRTFQDVTIAAGVNTPPVWELLPNHWGGMAAGDLNNDGYLDFVSGQWNGPIHFFLNDGRGGFTNLRASAGFPEDFLFRHQPILWDFDGDGWLDIYFAVDFAPNELWLNQRDSTFVDGAAAAGLASWMNEMGIAFGDYDNDGDLDLYITNIYRDGKRNVLLRNDSADGTMRYAEVSVAMGVEIGWWGWGTTFLDADNDGDLDLAATNGWRNGFWATDTSRFFLNVTPGERFADVSRAIGFDDVLYGAALVSADFDRDGDLDMLQTVMAGSPRLMDCMLVDGATRNNYLVVQPRMDGPNRFAVGALVTVEAQGRRQIRPILAGTSYLGQEPFEAHFGLGQATTVDRITVRWPDGSTTTRTAVPANQVVTVRPTPPTPPAPPPPSRLALRSAALNPTNGAFAVSIALPGDGPARLEVLDLAGRRLARRDVGALGPGTHVVPVDETAALPAGVYLVRLTQGKSAASLRVAVVR